MDQCGPNEECVLSQPATLQTAHPWFPSVPSVRSQKSDRRFKLHISDSRDPTAHGGGASRLNREVSVTRGGMAAATFLSFPSSFHADPSLSLSLVFSFFFLSGWCSQQQGALPSSLSRCVSVCLCISLSLSQGLI